ncbi:uncharacterized protein M421DRAFT_3921 [Didymella exigua CBS 183.55]|uniref:Uncharacterized protein n=1 Tax=Didymella exigua CBS 183.55 TaxID=1150837 RepID=A0A6A5RV57_9PLEO|nr:uncharacterized protein M421DRAFT_3921 [Didymella exigua CBS 183.55]KAF1930176.1 hypothetical protein M421DRAFT_3921 [Didymella exigua CBS 183.55]
MDPTHRTHGPPSLPRALLLRLVSIATRLTTLIVKVIGTALAVFLVPRTIHVLVLCLDGLYEMLGRRAASPWELQSFSGFGAVVGLLIMAVLHHLLFLIGYGAIFDEDLSGPYKEGAEKGKRGVTWERVLMRVIIPLFLYGGLCVLAWRVWKLSGDGREVVRANTVDLVDDAGAGLVWRDR